MESKITTCQFEKYLLYRGMIKSKVWIVNSGAYAIVFTEPDFDDFTKIVPLGQGQWKVILESKDFLNEKLTDNFFTFEPQY